MAWTTPRTWTDTEFVDDDIMNPHIRDNFNAIGPIVRIRTTADVSVNNDATLNNDTELFFPVAASEVWLWQAVVGFTCGAGGGLMSFTAPSGAVGAWHFHGTEVSSVHQSNMAFAATQNIGAVTDEPITLSGVVVNGATPGNLQFQWSQSSSNAANTTRRIHSFLIANRFTP